MQTFERTVVGVFLDTYCIVTNNNWGSTMKRKKISLMGNFCTDIPLAFREN